MQQKRQKQQQTPRIHTASEVAEFEYCPLSWWYEQFEPLAQADTEELFARLVELEYEHGLHAPRLPEYQMVEQLLLRRGAFEEGQQQHHEHAEEVAEIAEERSSSDVVPGTRSMRYVLLIVTTITVIGLVLLVIPWIIMR